MKKPILWITDPWSTLDHPFDTTLRIMEEQLRMKQPAFWCDSTQIEFSNREGCVVFVKKLLKVTPERELNSFTFGEAKRYPLNHFSKVMYRVDPPVDSRYLLPYLLLHNDPHCPELTPPAELVLGSTEKIEATKFGKHSAITVLTQRLETLEQFAKKEGSVVMKPLNEAQSKGVIKVSSAEPEKIAAAIQLHIGQPLVAQEFLHGIFKGETRLWLVNGTLLACAKKIPAQGNFKIDMDQGGKVATHQLNALEKRVILVLQRYLKKNRVRLAAIDLIDGKITDLNFTSPGLLVQMETLLCRNLASEVVKKLGSRF